MKQTLCTLGLATVLLTGVAASGFAATDSASTSSTTGTDTSGNPSVLASPGSSGAGMPTTPTKVAPGTYGMSSSQPATSSPTANLPAGSAGGASDSGGK